MVDYNPGQPLADEIVIDDVNATATVNGVAFPFDFNGGALQIGHLAGHDPFVRFQVNASAVRRITAQGETVYAEPDAPFADPDYEPDEPEE